MNEKNGFLTALGWIASLGLLIGFIMSLIPRGIETADLATAVIGAGLFQLGIVASIGWLVARAVIAQLLYKAPPTLAQREAERSS